MSKDGRKLRRRLVTSYWLTTGMILAALALLIYGFAGPGTVVVFLGVAMKSEVAIRIAGAFLLGLALSAQISFGAMVLRYPHVGEENWESRLHS